jgi:nucleotide-binding universal stress UspA family protein
MHVRPDEAQPALRDDPAGMTMPARVSTELVHSGDAAATLLQRAGGHDLVAVGAHIGSRAGGIMLGSVASRMVHEAHVPVLVARRPPEGSALPDRVLLATDGSGSSTRAAMLAARIAGRLGSQVLVLRVGTDASAAERHEVARQTAELMEATGLEPVVVERDHRPHETITEVARSERISLLALGGRGHTGVRALASTSERVAHEAPCSVLVARS